jgi:hypothetical protein
MVPTTCSVETCDSPKFCKGFCTKHYQRNAKYGTPTPCKQTEHDRFWAKVSKGSPDECWPWQGGLRGEYGFFNREGTTIGAHKYAYLASNGSIPDGMQVDHKCHVPACVNPAHLQAVTPMQNNENHSGPTRRNTSGVRGVYLTADKSWRGQVTHAGRSHSAGSHPTREMAAQAVRELRNQLHTNNLRDRANA